MKEPILISSCLLGLSTRYDGASKRNQAVLDWLASTGAVPVPVCPEQLGGLATPREQTRFQCGDGDAILAGSGRIISLSGIDMNRSFLHGAREVACIARMTGCRQAILKERSPSCGVRQIHRGEELVAGRGVTAALLAQAGIALFSEEQLPPAS
jgi:uncharacterized protein YbbK (DUF523 family)